MAYRLEPPTDKDAPEEAGGYLLNHQATALSLIRTKLDELYKTEPDALMEEAEAEAAHKRSKHQKYMHELVNSGKDLAQIQTEWHRYYTALPDVEKFEVWQEFYDANQHPALNKPPEPKVEPEISLPKVKEQQPVVYHAAERAVTPKRRRPSKSAKKLKEEVNERAAAPPKLTLKHHLQSALFGLSMGAIVVIILLFGFFNEVIITPFIQPSRHDTATPLILNTDSVAPSSTPEVIIPKINVEIPVDYSINTTDENVIENDLEDGVIHYPTTVVPGQNGNAAYFGHSSNNILNPGKYKFAFVLLHDLVPGDIFYLTYNNKVYVYKVFNTAIVDPGDVGVLDPVSGHIATATLITCDPPGTSLHRLIVVGDQISPSPTTNVNATPVVANTGVSQLPGNGPSLWNRYISTLWGKIVSAAFVLSVIYIVWRWINREFKSPALAS